MKDGSGWFSYNLDHSYVSREHVHDGVSRDGAFTQAEVRVRYCIEYNTGGMRLDVPKLTVLRSKNQSSDIHRIPSFADQYAIVMAEVAGIEETAPSACGSVH